MSCEKKQKIEVDKGDKDNDGNYFWSPGWISREMPSDWASLVRSELELKYVSFIETQVAQEYRAETCFPHPNDIFNALRMTPVDSVRVVIIGQDPYHGEGQAHGLAFSVAKPDVQTPPSLVNIFKELSTSSFKRVDGSNLSSWAKQGVLLLNTTLTVRKGQANSHEKLQWSRLTNALIRELSRTKSNIVFMLWGAHAKKLRESIVQPHNHLILEAAHPSPLSAHKGFLGCGHFTKANEYITRSSRGSRVPIQWV